MTLSSLELSREDRLLWFCLKSQPKHEHLAAAKLESMLGIATFAPRIRYQKSTSRGAVWFVEALFPGYLFARFNYREAHRQVQAAPGVTSIVRFGDSVAVVQDELMENLRQVSGDEKVIVFAPETKVGDRVQIVAGAFKGLEAVVTQVLPSKERVRVLLDFLGRSIEAEVRLPEILPTDTGRAARLGVC